MFSKRNTFEVPVNVAEQEQRLVQMLKVGVTILAATAAVTFGATPVERPVPETHSASFATEVSPELQDQEAFDVGQTTTTEQIAPALTTIPADPITTEPITTVPPPPTTTSLPRPAPPVAETQPRPRTNGRSHEQRCRDAIAKANVEPAPGYFITCGPESLYNSGEDGDTCIYYFRGMPAELNENSGNQPHCPDGDVAGQTNIHPDDSDSDAVWVETVRHEVGHQYCYYDYQDRSEACAHRWASQH